MTTFKPTLESYNSHSGFLENKSKTFRRWKQRFFVCEDRKLKHYSDETLQELIDELQLTPDTVVQTMPPEGEKRNIFILYNPGSEKEKLILNAQDATSLELWMIALIQGSQGEFQEEENFDTGHDLASGDPHFDGMLSLESIELTGATSEEPIFSCNIAGNLFKRNQRNNIWKKRFFILDDSLLFRCYANDTNLSAENLKRCIILDASSRVVVLPSGFERRRYGFALITTHDVGLGDAPAQSLRMSAVNEEELNKWVNALRSAIAAAQFYERGAEGAQRYPAAASEYFEYGAPEGEDIVAGGDSEPEQIVDAGIRFANRRNSGVPARKKQNLPLVSLSAFWPSHWLLRGSGNSKIPATNNQGVLDNSNSIGSKSETETVPLVAAESSIEPMLVQSTYSEPEYYNSFYFGDAGDFKNSFCSHEMQQLMAASSTTLSTSQDGDNFEEISINRRPRTSNDKDEQMTHEGSDQRSDHKADKNKSPVLPLSSLSTSSPSKRRSTDSPSRTRNCNEADLMASEGFETTPMLVNSTYPEQEFYNSAYFSEGADFSDFKASLFCHEVDELVAASSLSRSQSKESHDRGDNSLSQQSLVSESSSQVDQRKRTENQVHRTGSSESVESASTGVRHDSESKRLQKVQKKVPTFHVNDDTLWGKLFRSDVSNPDVAEQIDQFYKKYFTVPINNSHQDLMVNVYENQRYLPLRGWNCLHLIVSVDPWKLTDVTGKKFPNRYLKCTDPPKGYYWPSYVRKDEQQPVGYVSVLNRTTSGVKSSLSNVSKSSTEKTTPRKQLSSVATLALTELLKDEELSPLATGDAQDAVPFGVRPETVSVLTSGDNEECYCNNPDYIHNSWRVIEKDQGIGEGWRYATSFQRFAELRRMVPPRNPHFAARKYDVTRRRLWTRIARPLPETLAKLAGLSTEEADIRRLESRLTNEDDLQRASVLIDDSSVESFQEDDGTRTPSIRLSSLTDRQTQLFEENSSDENVS